MRSALHHWLVALGLSMILLAEHALAGSLQVLDISQASAAEVRAQRQSQESVGWWLEMGKQLVLYGDPVESDLPLLASYDGIDPNELLLRARGCSDHAIEAGELLARGGRWELRRVPLGMQRALNLTRFHAWRKLTPNARIARQYRLDAPAQRGAADPALQAVVDRIDAARWFADLEALAAWDRSSYGTSELSAARDWIAAQFDGLGLDDQLQPFNMNAPGGGAITRFNVSGAWTGSSDPQRWVIVGAHYDSRNASGSSTVNTPGAEDNASGCAGVVELARALLPSQPAASILFICYAGEEQGLIGSSAHVQSLIGAGQLSSVEAVVIMDMIGYSADANLEALYESSGSYTDYLQRFGAAAAIYVPELAVITSTNPFGSDHVPYLQAGVQTVLAIESDWDIYPHYHRSSDLPANMGPNALAMGGAILRTNAAVIAEIAGVDAALFADGFE